MDLLAVSLGNKPARKISICPVNTVVKSIMHTLSRLPGAIRGIALTMAWFGWGVVVPVVVLQVGDQDSVRLSFFGSPRVCALIYALNPDRVE